MSYIKSIFTILLLSCLSIGLTRCTDDILLYNDGLLKDGETILNLEAAFTPFAEKQLSRSSNSAPAGAFNSISDMVILVFNKEGQLMPSLTINLSNDELNELGMNDEGRTNADASDEKSAESKTLSVKNIPLKLPFGEYYIIGVANLGKYQASESNITTTKTTFEVLENDLNEDFTLDKLRSKTVSWDNNDYANNREMLGYFTDLEATETTTSPNYTSTFTTVKVNRPGMKLRTWLRRCASKITVDFDGEDLRDNIRIYIKDVTICDLAKTCTLGFGSPSSNYEDQVDFNNHPNDKTGLIEKGGSIQFGEGEEHASWPCISKNSPFIKDDSDNKKDLHSDSAPALYFYENMQGKEEGRDRTPIPNYETGGVTGVKEKDGVDFGTYIEVSAHYVSEADGNSDSYDITYRFMLGKNVTDDFDAERNYHYKLTLKFRGNANEYSWQIDYNPTTSFVVPNPWYVSYLYNHDAYLPFEFVLSKDDVDKGYEVSDMTAEIVKNPWYPTTGDEGYNEDVQNMLSDPKYEIIAQVPAGDGDYPYKTGSYPNNPENDFTGNGFLSLRAPKTESVLTDIDVTGGNTWGGYVKENNNINQAYFVGERNSINYSKRQIYSGGSVVKLENEDPKRETIYAKREDNIYNINLPLFTREKVLVKQTGYTGNNPFVGYQRVAKIKLTAILKIEGKDNSDKTIESYVNVVQVRRVVNPKGVYRSKDNYAPFHVNLKFLSEEGAAGEFRSIKSRGPWSAEVLGDKNFITLDGKQQVGGATGSEIDFTIRFNRMAGDRNKNAIVRIKYHNYTCTHLIFVRKGYEAQAIYESGRDLDHPGIEGGSDPTVWNTFNMIAKDKMAEDPRDEGSLFKFGNADDPIASINNVYIIDGNEAYHELTQDEFNEYGMPMPFKRIDSEGNIVDNTTIDWGDITFDDENGFTKYNEEIRKAATMRDFEQLYLTKYVEFGYGVLYADGATDTQYTQEMVYGWHSSDKSGDKNKKGMRGVFAYYWNIDNLNDEYNGKNVFFPIGRSGYGHRKNKDISSEYSGILRYASNRYKPACEYSTPYDNFQYVSPLFEFLYRRMGAIYWARQKTDNLLVWNGLEPEANSWAYGLDFNYFTFDVNAIFYSNIDNGADACFVRTVKIN